MQETIEGRLPVSSQKIGEKTIECFKKMINPEVLENYIIEVSKTNKKRLRNHKLTNWEIVIKRKEETHMEVRPTKMLTEKELREDLGISRDQLLNFIDLEIFHPIRLGRGRKFSQQEILEFQRKYAGLDVSNYHKAKKAKEYVDSLA